MNGHQKEDAPKLSEQRFMDEVPEVSILCITFNHADYIRRCIEGFLEQRIDFSVEIIVHDDASTDGTREILLEYKEKYPDLFELILQEENQFSKGAVMLAPGLENCRGNFVAFCHGDDYWVSNYKLQHQHGFLKNSPCGIVGNPSISLDQNSGEYVGTSGFAADEVVVLSDRQVIKRSGNVVPYSSIMVNKIVKERIKLNVPPVRNHTGLQILGAYHSGIGILPYLLSAYRINVPDSTTSIMLASDDKKISTSNMRIPSLHRLRALAPVKLRFGLERLLAQSLLVAPRSFFNRNNLDNIKNAFQGQQGKERVIFCLAFLLEAYLFIARFFFSRLKRLFD